VAGMDKISMLLMRNSMIIHGLRIITDVFVVGNPQLLFSFN